MSTEACSAARVARSNTAASGTNLPNPCRDIPPPSLSLDLIFWTSHATKGSLPKCYETVNRGPPKVWPGGQMLRLCEAHLDMTGISGAWRGASFFLGPGEDRAWVGRRW